MRAIALVLGLIGVAGCAPVKPYERELLTLPGMSLASTTDGDLEQHMLESREASAGGYGAKGGGCGCN